MVPPAAPAAAVSENPDPLLQALGHDPVALEALIARTGWPAERLNALLLELELDGQVARLPGQLFQRISQG
jgi:DNA processing protein